MLYWFVRPDPSLFFFFFFSSRRRHTRFSRDWSSGVLFRSNLDPNDLGDDALLRRIKFKFEIVDPTEEQWREIWKIMCRVLKVPYDDRGLDYLLAKWDRPDDRPLRMCQPRDILLQMTSI